MVFLMEEVLGDLFSKILKKEGLKKGLEDFTSFFKTLWKISSWIISKKNIKWD